MQLARRLRLDTTDLLAVYATLVALFVVYVSWTTVREHFSTPWADDWRFLDALFSGRLRWSPYRWLGGHMHLLTSAGLACAWATAAAFMLARGRPALASPAFVFALFALFWSGAYFDLPWGMQQPTTQSIMWLAVALAAPGPRPATARPGTCRRPQRLPHRRDAPRADHAPFASTAGRCTRARMATRTRPTSPRGAKRAAKKRPARAAAAKTTPRKRAAAASKNRAVAARALAESTSTHPLKRTRTKAEAAAVERLRTLCLALPGATEKIAWGEATWRAGKMFAQMDTHHHGAAHVAVWLPARAGVQEVLVEEDPEHYFRPPYVGAKGWVGVRIDNDPDWRAVAGLVAEAYREVAPAGLVSKLDAAPAKPEERGWRASWLDDEPEP